MHSVDYNPLSENQLALLMAKAGFRDLGTHESFEFAPFEEKESVDIIIVGKNNTGKKRRMFKVTAKRPLEC